MLSCRLDFLTPQLRQQRRQQQLQHLQLNPAAPPPIFQAAIAKASQQFKSELVWCSFVEYDRVSLIPILGTEHLQAAQTLRSQGLAYRESYAQYIIDAQQPLAIADIATQDVLATGQLYQRHGVQAYCGVPLITAADICIGVLAIASLTPRVWTVEEIAGLELIACWCLATHERDCAKAAIAALASPDTVMLKLLQALNQDFRKPLTTIMGMTRILEQQVYGQLSDKQAEYMRIVRQSGEQLLTTVEEVATLGELIEQGQACTPTLTDIERLVQQVLQQLAPVIETGQHTLNVSLAPGARLWPLDKQKITPVLYHLLYCLLHNLATGSQVYLHITDEPEGQEARSPQVRLTLWANHPQLMDYATPQVPEPSDLAMLHAQIVPDLQTRLAQYPQILSILHTLQAQSAQSQPIVNQQEVYRLLLCCELLAMHGGTLGWQLTERQGHCYMIMLPSGNAVEGMGLTL